MTECRHDDVRNLKTVRELYVQYLTWICLPSLPTCGRRRWSVDLNSTYDTFGNRQPLRRGAVWDKQLKGERGTSLCMSRAEWY